MTVLFLTRLFYPHIGGVEKHVLEVGRRLVKKGHKVIVLTEDYIDPYQSQGKSAKSVGEDFGIKIYRIESGSDDWFKKFRIWFNVWEKRGLIKKADIIHCHDVFFWYLPFRFLYPQKSVFTTFHGFEAKVPPSKKAIFIRKLSEWLSLGNICVGDYIKKWYGTRPTYVTYGAVSEIKNLKLKIKNHNSKTDIASRSKILFIGRLERDMGIQVYLKALEILREKGLKFEFEAIGDGSLRNEVEKYGKVHGFVRDLKLYIDISDVVFSSSYLSILEALAFRKPVFSVYDNPLKKDYLKMAPFAKWIVIEKSSSKLADKIQSFLKNPREKDQSINKSFEWIKTQSWDRLTNLYLKLYGL